MKLCKQFSETFLSQSPNEIVFLKNQNQELMNMKLESFSFRKRNTLNRTQQLSLKKLKKISTSWKTIP